MTGTEACQAAIKAQAVRYSVCQGYAIQTVVRFASLCPDYYFNADSNRTVASVAACLDQLAARSCTDLDLKLFPSCLARGKRPAGADCVYSSQCQTGMCGSNGTQCSTCSAPIPVGSSCAGGMCEDGSFCHQGTGVCTDASTIVYATQGQQCDLSATPVVGCAGDLLCLYGTAVSNFGTCQPFPGAGQPCVDSSGGKMLCAAGTACTGIDGAGTATCALPSCGAGPACDDASFCASVDGGFACVPRPTVGQPCDAFSAPETCLAPAVCMASTRGCAIARAVGESCDADNPCADLLLCIGGTCQATASANCPVGGGDGGTG
jgi:hypothetical protein